MTIHNIRTARRRLDQIAYAARRAIAIIAVAGAPALAVAQDAAPDAAPPAAVQRPKFSFLRYTEDWSVLADLDPAAPADPWDAIKHVPLSDDGSVWASFGGHARLRMESWQNFGFGAAPNNDDTFLLWRVLLHADIHFGENVRAFVEGKTTGSTDRDLPGGRRTLDVDSLALEQAFMDFRFRLDDATTLTLRPGRQTLLFGKQRLVSPLPWANTLRRWDGVSTILKFPTWKIHGFFTQFVPVQKYEFNDPDRQTLFYGVYATSPVALGPIGADVYFLGLDRSDNVTFNGTTGNEERYTLGSRLFGKIGGTDLDFDVEGAYQFGRVGSGDVSAFMLGSQLGWKPPDCPWQPRLFAGFDYGSGDDSPGGDVETFNHLFPLGHAYLGYIDAIGRQNVRDFNLGVTAKPMGQLTLGLTGHFFWRDDTSDAVYNAGGGVVRAGNLGNSREIGQEIDLTAKYQFNRHLQGLVGYSHFFAGDFINESGAGNDIDFIYVQVQYTF
jgi:hypothetical protein